MLNGAGVQSLRLLLADPRMDLDELDWAELRAVAARGGVLVRLADAVRQRGVEPPAALRSAAAAACARAQRALEIADRLGARCARLGLPHAFLRSVERYPDSGTVTLLVASHDGPAIDRDILRDLPATPCRQIWQRRISGASSYVTAYGIPLRIRHGRLGRFGEHARHARMLVERARPAAVGHSTLRAPSIEDHLLLLAIERSYARPAVHLDDLAWMIPVLGAASWNWDYVFAAAMSIGMLESVGAFLAYANAVHRQLCAYDLVPPVLLMRFGEIQGDRDDGLFPLPRAFARSYARHLGATLESGRWHSAARLSLLPLAAAWGAWRQRSSA